MKKLVLGIIYRVLAVYAHRVIAEHKPFVIAITGSVGKTSTKEAVYKVLSDHFGRNVRATAGNLNAEIGIPLTILGYNRLPLRILWPFFLIQAYFRTKDKFYPKIIVLEMGVEHPGDIRHFTDIATPDIAVITSTEPAHLANFPSLSVFQNEKTLLSHRIKGGGVVIVNADDPILRRLNGVNQITIGIEERADFQAKDVKFSLSGTDFRVVSTGQRISIKSKLLGEHLIYAQLFAYAVGQRFDISSLQIKKSLEELQPIAGRMNLIKGRRGIEIIDDSYNANPASVKAVLKTLAEIESKGRKVVILGNMNELGSLSYSSHREIGKILRRNCDLAIFVGENAEAMAEGYGNSGKHLVFAKRTDLMKKLDEILLEGDLVLIKASQNKNFFEEIVKALMCNPNEAAECLVRQGREWRNKKK